MNEYRIIKYRIFGSHDCDECNKMRKAMDLNALDFEFIDCEDPDNESFADDNDVDEMPHLQAFFEDNKEVIVEHKGYISPKLFQNIVKQRIKVRSDNSPTKTSVREIPVNTKSKSGCSECRKKK